MHMGVKVLDQCTRPTKIGPLKISISVLNKLETDEQGIEQEIIV